MRSYFKKFFFLIVFIASFPVQASSYADFFAAIRQDDAKVIGDLIRRGFEPNTPSPDGQHPLLMAVRLDSIRAAEALVDAKATRVDERNAHGETPLMLAALRGHLGLVKRLLAREADVNMPGWTPLHYAATRGHVDIMRLLIEAHAYLDAESPNGTTPLMMAAHYGSADAVRLLLSEGADPTLKNEQGLNAVDFAQRANRRDMADLIAAAIRRKAGSGRW